MTAEREKVLKDLERALIGLILGLAAIVIMIRTHPNKTESTRKPVSLKLTVFFNAYVLLFVHVHNFQASQVTLLSP